MKQMPLKCNEIDHTLEYKQLPAQMIVSDFVKNEKCCNYEIYLRDFINESSYFQSLSKGEKFEAPLSESNGESDAISANYSLDFKLMVSTSRMEAASILSGSITKIDEGIYEHGSPKVQDTKTCTRLCQTVRYKDERELEAIYNQKEKKEPIDEDISDFLNTLKKYKNIMLFIPFEFSYLNERSEEDAINGIKQAICFDLEECVKWRENRVKKYDTFVATIYNKKVLFFKISIKGIEYIDSVETVKSPTFMKLYNLTKF